MGRGKSRAGLKREWISLRKDWFSIYNNWTSLRNATYAEEIAGLILKDLDLIAFDNQGLRYENFRIPDHKGQCELVTGIERVTEKRFLRAIFNLGQVPPLGAIFDYEVPLKAHRGALHGDIDLVSLNESGLLIIEAKMHYSTESLLRPILQVYTYARAVHARKAGFMREYQLKEPVILIAALLTFISAFSGRQLLTLNDNPNIATLLSRLNNDLTNLGEGRMEFYMVDVSTPALEKCLINIPQDSSPDKILFKDDFQLRIRREYT